MLNLTFPRKIPEKSGQTLLLLFCHECRKNHHPASVESQLCRAGNDNSIAQPLIDDREGLNVIRSRVGLEAEAKNFEKDDNLLQTIEAQLKTKSLNCVLVDEAQFLTRDQVIQLGDVVDRLGIPVLCYGLRTDFLGELFEGSRSLLAWADELREIKTVCHCGKKAIMTVRLNEEGKPLQAGEQIQIGGNESYVSMCRRHFKSSLGLSEI